MSCSKSNLSRRGCKSKTKSNEEISLENLVEVYKKDYDLHRNWKRVLTIPEAVFGDFTIYTKVQPLIDTLSVSQWSDFLEKVKPHSHQYPRPYSKEDLREIAKYLAEHWNRSSFKDFEDLYDYVCSILLMTPSNLSGIVKTPHSLILYDIALRLAYRYGVWSEKYVYLNGNGPFEGIKALKLSKYIRRDRKILYSDIIKHYPELTELDAAQLEDFLCIFRKQF